MSLEQNKTVARRFFEAYAANDQRTLKEVVAPDLVANLPGSPRPLSREAMLNGIRTFHDAFSDGEFTVDDVFAEGDRVATRTTMRAVHTGAYQGHPPTGKQIEISALSIERIEDGQIVERWLKYDLMELMRQLGVVPPAG